MTPSPGVAYEYEGSSKQALDLAREMGRVPPFDFPTPTYLSGVTYDNGHYGRERVVPPLSGEPPHVAGEASNARGIIHAVNLTFWDELAAAMAKEENRRGLSFA